MLTQVINFRGFTLVELLVVVLLIGILSMALFQLFVVVQSTYLVNLEKVYLQRSLRALLAWIVKDIRQSLAQNIATNNPSHSYIKFNKIINYTPLLPANPYILESNFTEYLYDSITKTITRRILYANGTEIANKRWLFDNITEPPFYVRNRNNDILPLDGANILNNTNLVVRLSGQKIKDISGRQMVINLTLEEEVRIRNY